MVVEAVLVNGDGRGSDGVCPNVKSNLPTAEGAQRIHCTG